MKMQDNKPKTMRLNLNLSDKPRTMTLNLSASEMLALERLAEARGLTKTALVRQALRLYASVTERVDRGDKIFVEHSESKEKAELMVLG